MTRISIGQKTSWRLNLIIRYLKYLLHNFCCAHPPFSLDKNQKMLKAVMFLRMIALPFFINCHVRLNANANELLLIKKNKNNFYVTSVLLYRSTLLLDYILR